MNACSLSQHFLELGLLDWRAGQDPTEFFKAAGEWYDAGWELFQPDDRVGAAHQKGAVDIAQYLVGRRGRLGFSWEEHRGSPYISFTYENAFRLFDQPLPEKLKAQNDRYVQHRKGILTRSFITHRKLFDYEGTAEGFEALVREAEKNWLDRRTDRALDDTDFTMGYANGNDLVVDLDLGAILKKRNWQGESIHRWRWG